jgi:hypothetical protein
MDLESINAEIRSAEDTARTNEAKIAQSQVVLERAAETLERMERKAYHQQPQRDSNPCLDLERVVS